MKTLSQKIGNIGKARRKRVEARAAVLMAEEMTLQKIRQARECLGRRKDAKSEKTEKWKLGNN